MKHKGTIRKVYTLVRQLQPGLLLLILLTRGIIAALPFISLIFSSRILDMVIDRQPIDLIMQQVLIMVLCNFVLVLIQHALEKTVNIKKRILGEKIYQMICEKTLCIDYEVLEKKETLEMIQRAEDGMKSRGDIGDFCDLLGWFLQCVCTAAYAIGMLVELFVPVQTEQSTLLLRIMNSPLCALLPVVVMAVSLVVMLQVKRWLQDAEQRFFEESVKRNRSIYYYLGFITNYQQGKYVRLYHMKDMILQAFRKNMDENEQFARAMTKKSRLSEIVELGVLFVFQFCSYLYVGIKATIGLISLGSVLKFVGCFRKFFDSVLDIMFVWVEIDIRCKYLSYFYDYMELKNKKYEGTLPVEKRNDNEFEIEFRNVSFHYPNSSEMVLSHVNTKISLGSKTAVVGPNGAGKSTFIKLLCRLYDPTEGEILLNGINIKLYDYDEYVRLFAVVFQDSKPFSFSLAENVAASKEYDAEKVLECLEKAGLGERVKELPAGICTNIYQMEEDGIEISGGEAQKLVIARALYKDVPYVILDEPTSALDPVSEYEIYRHFDELVKDKTSIYISHRMSSCRFCDTIYVFDEGKIVQSGSHDVLMQEPEGLYHQMWTAQAQYYTA